MSCRVLGMAWLSPGEQQLDLQGRSLLAVLHEVTGGEGALHCIAGGCRHPALCAACIVPCMLVVVPGAVCIIASRALTRSCCCLLVGAAVASQPPVVHVDCLAVNWVEGTLSPGPWSLRCITPQGWL